jgi:hypothetical protein
MPTGLALPRRHENRYTIEKLKRREIQIVEMLQHTEPQFGLKIVPPLS